MPLLPLKAIPSVHSLMFDRSFEQDQGILFELISGNILATLGSDRVIKLL
jgi:hypothetical protein